MADTILVLYGSYRADRVGIRLANFLVDGLRARGAASLTGCHLKVTS